MAPAVKLEVLSNSPAAPEPKRKPPVDPATLVHRELLDGPFWQRIPAYANVTEAEFLDHNWQAKHSITKPEKLLAALQGLVTPEFAADTEAGFKRAPMSVRVSPYMLSLIDWDAPYEDPLRIQFIPVASRLLPDHPKLDLDSLHEQEDAPVQGLTHRYPDKALFLPLDTCPVYCRFCTRSYAVGVDTEEVEKVSLKANEQRWLSAYEYMRSRPELEDIVISGGDVYQLRAQQIEDIGNALLDMPNVRRMRFATKGPAVMPQKILTDHAWIDALTRVVDRGRKMHKEVVLHTHFNHPKEITEITAQAMVSTALFEMIEIDRADAANDDLAARVDAVIASKMAGARDAGRLPPSITSDDVRLGVAMLAGALAKTPHDQRGAVATRVWALLPFGPGTLD